MFVFIYYTTPAMVIFGAAITGVCYGALFPLMPAAIADFYGVRNLGVNYGLLFTAFGTAGVAGPIVGGLIHDHFHSYSWSYRIAGVMLLLGAAVALTVKAPKAEVRVQAPEPAGRAA